MSLLSTLEYEHTEDCNGLHVRIAIKKLTAVNGDNAVFNFLKEFKGTHYIII